MLDNLVLGAALQSILEIAQSLCSTVIGVNETQREQTSAL